MGRKYFVKIRIRFENEDINSFKAAMQCEVQNDKICESEGVDNILSK